jgi:hypothetical protein
MTAPKNKEQLKIGPGKAKAIEKPFFFPKKIK